MISAGDLGPFWVGSFIVGILIAIWSKTSRATEVEKRVVSTFYLVAVFTVPALLTRVFDMSTILVTDSVILAVGMLGLTRLRPYVIVFALTLGIALLLLNIVIPAITDPNSWCPSRHIVGGVCQAT